MAPLVFKPHLFNVQGDLGMDLHVLRLFKETAHMDSNGMDINVLPLAL